MAPPPAADILYFQPLVCWQTFSTPSSHHLGSPSLGGDNGVGVDVGVVAIRVGRSVGGDVT